MSAWAPSQWCASTVEGLSPQVVKWQSSPGFHFYIHDSAAKAAIVASGYAKTLKAARRACDAALAEVLTQRADARAIAQQIAEGGPAHEQEAA